MSYRQTGFFQPVMEPEYEKGMNMREKFLAFHEANPQVARRIAKMALDLQRKGFRVYGIAALFEVMRFDYNLTTDGDPFKLNNNYRAFYARLIMDKMPKLDGFFRTRMQPSQQWELAATQNENGKR